MDEFSFIERHLAPLAAKEKGALDLKDDAAVIAPKKGNEFVITKDAITEGVHFFSGDTPENIARKLLGVNLSDMAAMGAKPRCYLIAGVLTKAIKELWLKRFNQTLAEIQKQYGITMIGGDTSVQEKILTFSLTMIGEVRKGKFLRRKGAKPGDIIFVSGTIGDSALGLQILKNKINKVSAENKKFLVSRYHVPSPRVKLGQELIGVANAAIDISDGLIADLGHICECSGVSADVFLSQIPLSKAGKDLIKKNPSFYKYVLSGGDDYELCFTAPERSISKILRLAKKLRTPITPIGVVKKTTAGDRVRILDNYRKVIPQQAAGYNHFHK